MEKAGGLRRNTELFLLFVGAIPVFLLYAMYMITARSTLSLETMAVPIGLFAAFTVAHIAIRFLAPAADPAILPIVFVLSGIGITMVTRLAPIPESTNTMGTCAKSCSQPNDLALYLCCCHDCGTSGH